MEKLEIKEDHKQQVKKEPEYNKQMYRMMKQSLNLLFVHAYFLTKTSKFNTHLSYYFQLAFEDGYELTHNMSELHYSKICPMLHSASILRWGLINAFQSSVLTSILDRSHGLAFLYLVLKQIYFHVSQFFKMSEQDEMRRDQRQYIYECYQQQEKLIDETIVEEAKYLVDNFNDVDESQVKNIISTFKTNLEFLKQDAQYFQFLSFKSDLFDNLNKLESQYKLELKDLNQGYEFQRYERIYETLGEDCIFWAAFFDGQTTISVDHFCVGLSALSQIKGRGQENFYKAFNLLKDKIKEMDYIVNIERDKELILKLIEITKQIVYDSTHDTIRRDLKSASFNFNEHKGFDMHQLKQFLQENIFKGNDSEPIKLKIIQTLYDQDDELESMGLEEAEFKFPKKQNYYVFGENMMHNAMIPKIAISFMGSLQIQKKNGCLRVRDMTQRGYFNHIYLKVKEYKLKEGDVLCLGQAISYGIQKLDNNGIELRHISTFKRDEDDYFDSPEVIVGKFNNGQLSIGKEQDNEIKIIHECVNKRHCIIKSDGTTIDQETLYGTFLHLKGLKDILAKESMSNWREIPLNQSLQFNDYTFKLN